MRAILLVRLTATRRTPSKKSLGAAPSQNEIRESRQSVRRQINFFRRHPQGSARGSQQMSHTNLFIELARIGFAGGCPRSPSDIPDKIGMRRLAGMSFGSRLNLQMRFPNAIATIFF
jgi:hypothetical protein